MKKLCYKGDQYNEGLTISRLEKLGGMNNHGLWGNDPGLYYFIEKNGDIVSDTVIPDGYRIAEEDMYTEKEIRDTLIKIGMVPAFANKFIKHLNSNK